VTFAGMLFEEADAGLDGAALQSRSGTSRQQVMARSARIMGFPSSLLLRKQHTARPK
jgi:hypothetical protein